MVAGVAEYVERGLHSYGNGVSSVRGEGSGGLALHIVPVRGKPRLNTCIGTVRLRVRGSMLESGRKSSGAVS